MASPSNFVVNSLPAYVDTNRDLIIKNFALTGPGTRKYIGLQTGIKKDAFLNYLDLAPTLQDGSVCDASPAGSVTLSQRTISTAPIQVVMDICTKNLLGKYAEYLVKIGAGEADLPFEQYIVDTLTAEINKKIEALIWQGDTSDSDPNLKWIDGIIRQVIASDSNVPDYYPVDDMTAWNLVENLYARLPEETIERGARIFVSPAFFRLFSLELVKANLFHFTPDADPNEIILPGTTAIVTKAPGLAGTTFLVATFADNLVYGCDVEDDTERVIVRYDEIADVFKVRVSWNSGIAYHFPDQIVYSDYSEVTITSGTTPSSSLSRIAAAVDTIDDNTVIRTHGYVDGRYEEDGYLQTLSDGA